MSVPREYELPAGINPSPTQLPVTGPSVDREELTTDSGEVQELVQNPEAAESGVDTNDDGAVDNDTSGLATG